MGANDVLSQDEVDALVNGVDDGSVDTEPDAAPGEAREIDLANHERIVRGRMPTLEMVNDRFARYLRISLFNLLRRSTSISVDGVSTSKFSEYIHKLFVPTSLNLVRVRPLQGTALLVIDPRLMFGLVECYFGGDGRIHTKVEGREFTGTELRVARMVIDRAFADFKEAWAPVMDLDFEFQGSEVNPQFANIVSPTEVVVIASFQVDLEGTGGTMQIVFPYSMIEPIRGILDAGIQSDRSDVDDRWQKTLASQAKRADIEISSELTEVTLPVRDLLSLRTGDVIPIDMPEQVVLKAEGVPLIRGVFGVSNGMNAIRVTQVLDPQRDQATSLGGK